MREIILYIAQSIDGYIARLNGSVDWLSDYDSEGTEKITANNFATFFETIDIVILGRTTYQQVVNELSPDNWAFPGKEVFVLSSKKIIDPKIVSVNVDELLETIENASGKIWVVGGAMLLRFFLENNLIDKMIITTIPISLGKGISLFTAIDSEQKYKVLKVENYSGLVEVTYER